MEKKTVVISTVLDDVNEKLLSVGEKVMKDMTAETVLQPHQMVTRTMSTAVMKYRVHWVRSRIGIRKKRSVTKMVFIEKPKYSKRSRLSNFWPKMPRSKDLGDLLRYYLERTNHE